MAQQDSQSPGRVSEARIAGALLLLTALATAVAVIGRVAADADQATLAESLVSISEARGLYGLGGAARLISGVTLLAAAWYLSRTWIIRERLGTPLVPILLAVSGAFTAVSGACAVLLAVSAPDVASLSVAPPMENSELLRWLTGKIGFAAAGLALIVAARYQWKVGGALRYIAPASLVIGVAMQFIWFDAVTLLHRISGVAFLVWLIAVGGMLFTGRVERLFRRMTAGVS
ncbi:MAG: hypothetical protein F4Y49_03410 [Dehalococcoidia bacterium]|nr:hypothetical protein [Dehalococcoidia bacterium]